MGVSKTNSVDNDFEIEFSTLRQKYLELSEKINSFVSQVESLDDERKTIMKKITTLQKKVNIMNNSSNKTKQNNSESDSESDSESESESENEEPVVLKKKKSPKEP